MKGHLIKNTYFPQHMEKVSYGYLSVRDLRPKHETKD